MARTVPALRRTLLLEPRNDEAQGRGGPLSGSRPWKFAIQDQNAAISCMTEMTGLC